jgi:hypothetical protein
MTSRPLSVLEREPDSAPDPIAAARKAAARARATALAITESATLPPPPSVGLPAGLRAMLLVGFAGG